MAVNQMDQVTQQNVAMVEQSTAAARSLASDTEELSRLIGQFKLGNEAGAAAECRGRTDPRARRATPCNRLCSGPY